MNEQLAGIAMPLNIGAATGAAKAAKAKEDKKNLTLKHNRSLIEKLKSLGSGPTFIELQESDIKGISHPDLLKALKKFMAERAEKEFTTIKRRKYESARTFAFARNGSIRPVETKDVKIGNDLEVRYNLSPSIATTSQKPAKMSPSFLADILVKILKPLGLV